MLNDISRQPWIFSSRVDLMFIIGPAFFITALILVARDVINGFDSLPPWLWLMLIVGVDVSHVYSTVFRTYFDRVEMEKRRSLYLLTPLAAWIAGCLLYSVDGVVFWRALAYLAVFHFVRQQYGLMMIYGRKEDFRFKWIDKLAIYVATLYPLIYWHTHERKFNWFIENDFFRLDIDILSVISLWLYVIILVAYVMKEAVLISRSGRFNWPRNLMLLGTAISWLTGIVILDNDIAFTAINVISHGIPYLALVWIYGRNQARLQQDASSLICPWMARMFQRGMVLLYLLILFVWAFAEENLWDMLVWKEHGSVLFFSTQVSISFSEQTLVWLVPLLAMPQITHYVLDAFIWRMQTNDTNWKQILFLNAR